jgi:poly-gamma-glutamate capsule biosynthesis protein CapA/YwtB (metallophosphatase superfamily)
MPAIGLLGDVMLGRSVGDALRGRLADRPGAVWSDELRALCASLDLVVCNLECCLSDRGRRTGRIRAKPFFFRGPPHAVESLQAIGVGAASLANNHALDFEEAALADTRSQLEAAGIAAGGAGPDPERARRPASVDAGGVRLSLICVADHPREYAAGADAYGIAHADLRGDAPDWLLDRVVEAAATADAVVVFPHWGPNMNDSPAPWQLRVASQLHAAGADLVAGHSAHVFHGVGWDDRGPVLTDLGDALDDYRIDPVLRNDLGLLAIWRPDAGDDELELVGLSLDFCHTRLATGADADWIGARLLRACKPLGTRPERLAEGRFRIRPSD